MKTLLYEDTILGKHPVGITNGTLYIKEAPGAYVDEMVKKHHYSHKATKNRFKSFTVNEDKGFLQLGYGIRPAMKHTISDKIQKGNFCEFDRMWLSDELPKNSESQVIALLISYLKQTEKQIKFLITYADGSVGNEGTIYKATNAIRLGSVPCDFYILTSGERVHPVSMYHRHGTRKKAVLDELYPGITHVKGTERQYRFLYVLDRKYRLDSLSTPPVDITQR